MFSLALSEHIDLQNSENDI